jgi:hypothetical protein
MVFLPIVEREFCRATKRRRTYWVRTGAAIVAALIGIAAVTQLDLWIAASSVGRTLFSTISAIAFWLCLLTGVFTTSVSLSEEKRHGTLGSAPSDCARSSDC